MSIFSKIFGPSTLITAAFIGPGTITLCTLAGLNYGYDLLWALLFSVFATLVLQNISSRIGLITQDGLGVIISQQRLKGISGLIMFYLVIAAILVGNTAYEAGNIGGAVLGADLIIDGCQYWPIVIGGISFLLLYFGGYRRLQNVLIGLVIVISLSFLVTAFLLKPDPLLVLKGFVPSQFNSIDWMMTIGLIGTTVVPYNLFLHASIVKQKYSNPDRIKELKIENAVSIILGGIISMAILVVAASSGVTGQSSVNALAQQLEPLYGEFTKYAIGMGLLAAGISSAITAPYAAALAARELFGWQESNVSWKFRSTWIIVLSVGVLFSYLGYKPITVIKFAQIANGMLLPILAIYIVRLINNKNIVAQHTNTKMENIAGYCVVVITILIAIKTLLKVVGY